MPKKNLKSVKLNQKKMSKIELTLTKIMVKQFAAKSLMADCNRQSDNKWVQKVRERVEEGKKESLKRW